MSSLCVVPLADNDTMLGFYAIDNPARERLASVAHLLETVSNCIVYALRRARLMATLEQAGRERTQALMGEQMSRQQTRQIQEHLDMVNDVMRSGLWYVNYNTQGTVTNVTWSPRVRRMLGFSTEEEFPNTINAWLDRLHPQDKVATYDAIKLCEQGTETIQLNHRLKMANGSYQWFSVKAKTVLHANGKPRLMLGTFVNITKELESQQALQEAYQAANHANHAKTKFLATMSHDIRTPLNAIIGMCSIAQIHQDNHARTERCLREITHSSKHLLNLINEILDMNRIESGQVNLTMQPFALADLIDTFMTMARPLVDARHHTFEVSVSDVIHENVVGDRDRIIKCLMNFLGNAVKYTPNGGAIHLGIREISTNRAHRGCFEFSFQDNGIGMTQEFIEHIFDPFVRAEDVRVTHEQGTGLGLPITRNLIQMMNGTIKVESSVGQGSTFVATIFLGLQDKGLSEKPTHLGDVLVLAPTASAAHDVAQMVEHVGGHTQTLITNVCTVEQALATLPQGAAYETVLVTNELQTADVTPFMAALTSHFDAATKIVVASDHAHALEQPLLLAGAQSCMTKPLFGSRLQEALSSTGTQALLAPALDPLVHATKADFSGKRILLAEDNLINAEITRELLSEMNVTIDHVFNGQEALARLTTCTQGFYDLVLMDIQMPCMNGLDAAEAIRARKHPWLHTLPIVALSANAFAEDVKKSKSAGMNDHLAKPLDLEHLVTVLTEYLLDPARERMTA